MFLEGLDGKLFVNFKAKRGWAAAKRENWGISRIAERHLKAFFQAKQSKWIIMVGKPLQSHLPAIILMLLTALCNTD